MMPDLLRAVSNFRQWSKEFADASRSIGWELDYDEAWDDLYTAALDFLASKPFQQWSYEEIRDVLFVIARDNDRKRLALTIRNKHPHLLVPLARAALAMGEQDDRWQIAEQLGHLGKSAGEEEAVLLLLVRDEHEYVRRQALCALARIGSCATEAETLLIWERDDPEQQWARMMCLWSLHRVGSSELEMYLAKAESDPREYLRGYAARVRSGKVDP